MAISTAISEYNGFYLTPSDLRQVIYSHTDDKSLFNMIPVCQLFYTDLTNEFFEKRCKELVLNSLVESPFYDPFVKTINCPWKAVLFCSTDPGAVRLDHAAIMLARMPLEKFKLHLTNNTIPTFQENINIHQLKLAPICGRYYQDPESEIHKAWEHSQANWTEKDEADLKESKEKTSIEYYHHIAATSTSQQIVSFLMGEQKLHFDRLPMLWEKKRNAHAEYDKVESKRKVFQNNINANKATINNYNKIINNQNHLKQYATSIFQVVIKGMSASIKWNPHLPTLDKLCNTLTSEKYPNPSNELTPEGAKKAHQLICSLPEEASSSIWKNLYDDCANGIQERQWSEKHFHKHAHQLKHFATLWFLSANKYTSNAKIDPTTDITMLKPILMDELEEMPVGRGLPGPNPGECNLM